MTENIMIILWCVFILVILFILFRNELMEKVRPRITYQFQSWEKSDLPYISIDVQGRKMNMIVDSAAAVSLIRKEVLKDITYEESSRSINLAALTEDSINSEVVSIPITINGSVTVTDFAVYYSDDIAAFRKDGIIIDGLLGVEFFKATGGKIDFNKKTVTFP
jgi:hypothetical protein